VQDLFALHDDIVRKIVTTLRLQLGLREQGILARKTTDNLEAYDYYLRGLESFYRTTKEDNLQARQMYEKAVALDLQYAEAYARLGATYYLEWGWGWSQDAQTIEQGLVMTQRAVALDDSLSFAHGLLGMLYAMKKQLEQALAESERAIALDPNDADSYRLQAETLNLLGRPEEALRAAEQALRLNPRAPAGLLINLGLADYLSGRYSDAISTLKSLVARYPDWMSAYPLLTFSYVQQWHFQLTQDSQTLGLALEAAQRSVALNNAYSQSHLALGAVYLFQRQYEQAIAEMQQAIALDPHEAFEYALLAVALGWAGKSDEALQMVEQALQRKSRTVEAHLGIVGGAYYFAGKSEEAVASLRQYLSRYPNILGPHLNLAAAYSELGKDTEARAEAAEVRRINPNFSLTVHKERVPIKDPATLERHIAALRKAGLK
jgi:tetratricopeptide (TPR) repeat protein